MKKTVVWLSFFAVLLLSLCGCQSGKNNKSAESNTSYQSNNGTTTADSNNISNNNGGEPYKQGTFTTKEYYSEWINLYCDIPLDMRLDADFIELVEENNRIYGKKGELREMMAMNSDETKLVDIFVVHLSDKQTLEKYVNQHYQEIRNTYKENSVNGLQISDSGDNFSTYSFLGENYLLNTYKTETRYNGELRRAINYWDLFRVKEDRVIFIQCMAYQNSGVDFEDLLSMFTTYDYHFNPYSSSKNESSNAGDNSTTDDNSNSNSNNTESGNDTSDSNNSGSNSGDGSGTSGNSNNSSNSGNNDPGGNTGNSGSGSNSGNNDPGGNTGNSGSGSNSGNNDPGGNTGNSGSGNNSGNNNPGGNNKPVDPCANGHNWEAVESTVHHDQEGHYEMVKVEDGYTWYRCSVCGDEFKSSDSYYSHFDGSHSDVPFLREEYTHGTVYDQYDEMWVVDKEAYDETVIIEYKCSKCGKTKQ